MTKRNKILILIIGVVAITCMYIIAVINVCQDAKSFVNDVNHLTIGVSNYNDIHRFVPSYRKYITESCIPGHCILNFAFRNSLLSFLHLAPATEFTGSLTFDNALLSTRVEYLGQGVCCVHHIIEGKSLVAPNDPSHPDFSVTLQRDEDGFSSKAIVMLTPRATPEQRQAAYALDLRCLDKIGGCKSAEELSPQIWR